MNDDIKILDYQYDEKLKAYSLMTLMSVKKYLEISFNTEENMEIQRRIMSTRKSKIYSRLIQDLKGGCIIPPIVLVARNLPEEISNLITPLSINVDKIAEFLKTVSPTQVSILDGLQRTNCLRKAKEDLESDTEKLDSFLQKPLRIEFWMNIKFQAILYRMITLNAGQTPMSMKHQLEILNLNLKDSINSVRDDIEIFTSNDLNRRIRSKQYQFSLLVEGYNAFINKSAFTDVKNQVIEELNRIDFLESFENSKAEVGLEEFVNTIADMDELISNKYNQIENNESIKYGYQLFAKQTFFVGFCAALGRAYECLSSEQFQQRKAELIYILSNYQEDPLELQTYFDIIDSIPSKTKIGDIERELVAEAFINYFLSSMSFDKAWKYAGNKVV